MNALARIAALLFVALLTPASAGATSWSSQMLQVGKRGHIVDQASIAKDGSSAVVVGSEVSAALGSTVHTLYTARPGGRFTKAGLRIKGQVGMRVATGPGGAVGAATLNSGAPVLYVRTKSGRSLKKVQFGEYSENFTAIDVLHNPRGGWLVPVTIVDPTNTDDPDGPEVAVFEFSEAGVYRSVTASMPGALDSHGWAVDGAGRVTLALTKRVPAGPSFVEDYGTGATTTVYTRAAGEHGNFTALTSTPLRLIDPRVTAGAPGQVAVIGTDSADCSDYPCVGRTLLYRVRAGKLGAAQAIGAGVSGTRHTLPSVALLGGNRSLVTFTPTNGVPRAKQKGGESDLLGGRPYALVGTGKTGDFDRDAPNAFPYDLTPKSLSGGRALVAWVPAGARATFTMRIIDSAGRVTTTAAPGLTGTRGPSEDVELATAGSWAIAGISTTQHGPRQLGAAGVAVRKF